MSFFIHTKYNTPAAIKWLVAVLHKIKYKVVRPLISYLAYLTGKNELAGDQKSFSGEKLKKGISVYIPCKDEETHLKMCLESLLGIADQFILIDNGSTDATLEIMKDFQAIHRQTEIEVHSKPGMLLVDMVQFALSRVKYSWVLKWDGDMLAINEEKQFTDLKRRCLEAKRPAAYTLPRINLTGDYHHVSSWTEVVDAGEPFLRTFSNKFLFTEEYGRMEHAVIPLHYRLKLRKEYYSFHFSNLRPPARIMYRHCYLDWRETVNTGTDAARSKYNDFGVFRNAWFLHNFGSTDERTLKFRSGRLIASMCRKFDVSKYCGLPEILQSEKKPRFEVLYKAGKPYLMMDNDDPDMTAYIPSAEDERWIADYNEFFNDDKRLAFTK